MLAQLIVLMYAMVCTRPDLLQSISMISKYMHDPGRGHSEAVHWILRYIKGTIDIGLVFKKDVAGKQECIKYLILTMLETLTNAGPQRVCIYIVPSTGQLTLYSTVYCRVIYYGGQVYGRDRGYEGGNFASRVA